MMEMTKEAIWESVETSRGKFEFRVTLHLSSPSVLQETVAFDPRGTVWFPGDSRISETPNMHGYTCTPTSQWSSGASQWL